MPISFRWLWYLVGLAGMSLAIVGLLAMIGSIINDGLILPVLGLAAIGLGFVLVRYRRRPRRDGPGGIAASIPAATADVDDAAAAAPAKARRSDSGRTSRR